MDKRHVVLAVEIVILVSILLVSIYSGLTINVLSERVLVLENNDKYFGEYIQANSVALQQISVLNESCKIVEDTEKSRTILCVINKINGGS